MPTSSGALPRGKGATRTEASSWAQQRPAVVLLSGGLDSATTLWEARQAHGEVVALTIDYGQRHGRELQAAVELARAAGVKAHEVLRVDLARFGGSALTDPTVPVPTDRSLQQMGADIPPTYVPARNTVFLSLALALAEARGARALYIGAHLQDSSGYPDCRPAYFSAIAAAFALGTKAGVEGHPIELVTPVLQLGKAAIVRRAAALKVPMHLTWSCYGAGPAPCGRCDSCQLRATGFAEAGLPDPAAVHPRG